MEKISVSLGILLLLSGVSDANEYREIMSLLVGDTAVLNTGVPKISIDDTVQWMFGNERIAEIRRGTRQNISNLLQNFKDKLQLNETTGTLNITNIDTMHSGEYTLEIRNKNIKSKKFDVTVTDEEHPQSVMEGDTVNLLSLLENIKSYQIRLRFKDQVIFTAHLNGAAQSKDNIHLYTLSKELNITNIRSKQAGLYDVEVENDDNIMIFHKKCQIKVERNSGVSPGAAAGIVVGLLVFHWCLKL